MYNPTVIKEAEEEEGADIIICTSEKDEELPLFRFVTVKVPDFFFCLIRNDFYSNCAGGSFHVFVSVNEQSPLNRSVTLVFLIRAENVTDKKNR